MTATPQATDLDAAFQRAALLCSAAEAHGMLCGYHCAGRLPRRETWLSEVLDGADPHDLAVSKAKEQLAALWGYTQAQFALEDLSFQPLLPSDDSPLVQRATALGSWCQGFLYGLGASGRTQAAQLAGDAQEFLRDLQRIAAIRPDSQERGEEAEHSYAELLEYVRVGVMLVREQLREGPATEPGTVH